MPYETKTTLTLDEFKKFNYTIFAKKMKIIYAFFIAMIVFVVFNILNQGFIDSTDIAMLAFVFIWMLLYYPVINWIIRNHYKSTKMLQNQTTFMTFFDDYFIEKGENHTTKIKYDELYKIIETKTNFYLLIGKVGGSVVIKQNCQAQLIEFLQKIKKEFKK